VRVLVANHTSTVSGAEHALLDLLAALPADVEAVVACPDGELADRLTAAGHERTPLTGTAGSLKLGPRATPVAVGELARAAYELRGLARSLSADVVHANSIRSALSAIPAARLGGAPVVAHVHDCLPPGRVSAAVRAVVRRADVVVANSAYSARCLGAPDALVTFNPVDLARFDPATVDGARVRRELGIADGAPLLAIVGQITPWKGQSTAVEALTAVRAERADARLLVVGAPKFVDAATRYDNRAYLAALHEQVARAGAEDAVLFTGERDDVPDVVAAADLVLVPSWEEPFGRIVVEAMAVGTPVLATRVGGPAEVVSDGEDGLLLDPRDAGAWGRAAARLLADPDALERMGGAARRSARRFDGAVFARAMLQAYTQAAAGTR
jgi:L-malate glycosyltransferase